MSWFPFWPLLGLLAVAALLPLAANLLAPPRARGRREADLALYRAQLEELEREQAAGRLEAEAYRAAMVEVQRRLLAAPTDAGAAASTRSRRLLVAALIAVPALGVAIYLPSGIPEMPSAPYSMRQEAAAKDAEMIGLLRARLSRLPPTSDQAREGWALLANAERSRGNLGAAADAYQRAMVGKFDAEMTAQLAQVLLEDGRTEEAASLLAAALPRAPEHVGLRFLSGLAAARAGRNDEARGIWRALIADAPPGMPWRAMVERQMNALP